ncbi:MAG: helix-turn-helix domain-containing protein [Treponema sp.]|jgi:transcriptional regulator with XRE-family HTH domain|nr:helix-turn-helix domain-containing protein [Treponema sp.]
MQFWRVAIKQEPLRVYLSANIKARREILNISQEKLAELAEVSVQMIKRIEGKRTWVSDKMLTNLACVLGVSAFQLLVPLGETLSSDDSALVSGLLQNLRQSIHDDIDSRFCRVITEKSE